MCHFVHLYQSSVCSCDFLNLGLGWDRNKLLKGELFQEQTLTRIMYNKTDSELSISDKMGGLPVKQLPDSEEKVCDEK